MSLRGLFLILVLLAAGRSAFAQFPIEKSKVLYFNLPGIGDEVPYTKWSSNIFQANDSIVYDIKFNKWNRKVIAISYKRNEYNGTGYAKPISMLKFQLESPRIDTVVVEKPVTAELVKRINKYYLGKLIDSTVNADQNNP